MFSYPVFKVSTFELPIARASLPLKARGHFVSISTGIQIAILIFSPEERQEGEPKRVYMRKKGSPRREAFISSVDHSHFLDYQEKFVRFSLLRSNYFSRGTGVLIRY